MKLTKEEFVFLLNKKKAQGYSNEESFKLVKEFDRKIKMPSFKNDNKPKNKNEFLELFMKDIESRKRN